MKTCIIIGASVTSSLSAYVLAPFFEKIIILEQADKLGCYRKTLQQGSQFHVFLGGGQTVLSDLIPQIKEDFIKRKCPEASLPSEIDWILGDDLLASGGVDICNLYLMDRMVLEEILIDRLADHPNIEMVLGAKVLDIDLSGGCAKGVTYRKIGKKIDIPCDFLVAAGGRQFNLSQILQSNGFCVPHENFVSAEFMYVSQMRELMPGYEVPWKMLYEQGMPPISYRGAVIGKISEPRSYMFMVGGLSGHFPKTDAVREYTRTLKSPQFRWFYDHSVAVSEAKAYKVDGSHHTPYGDMGRAWPRGLVALGDTVCAFNPVYGQGLTVAAMEAKRLKELFCRSAGKEICTDQFQKEVDGLIAVPWMIGTVEDKRLYGHPLTIPERIVGAYVRALLSGAVQDPKLTSAFMSVTHMIKKPVSLMNPGVVWRVLRSKFGLVSNERSISSRGHPVRNI